MPRGDAWDESARPLCWLITPCGFDGPLCRKWPPFSREHWLHAWELPQQEGDPKWPSYNEDKYHVTTGDLLAVKTGVLGAGGISTRSKQMFVVIGNINAVERAKSMLHKFFNSDQSPASASTAEHPLLAFLKSQPDHDFGVTDCGAFTAEAAQGFPMTPFDFRVETSLVDRLGRLGQDATKAVGILADLCGGTCSIAPGSSGYRKLVFVGVREAQARFNSYIISLHTFKHLTIDDLARRTKHFSTNEAIPPGQPLKPVQKKHVKPKEVFKILTPSDTADNIPVKAARVVLERLCDEVMPPSDGQALAKNVSTWFKNVPEGTIKGKIQDQEREKFTFIAMPQLEYGVNEGTKVVGVCRRYIKSANAAALTGHPVIAATSAHYIEVLAVLEDYRGDKGRVPFVRNHAGWHSPQMIIKNRRISAGLLESAFYHLEHGEHKHLPIVAVIRETNIASRLVFAHVARRLGYEVYRGGVLYTETDEARDVVDYNGRRAEIEKQQKLALKRLKEEGVVGKAEGQERGEDAATGADGGHQGMAVQGKKSRKRKRSSASQVQKKPLTKAQVTKIEDEEKPLTKAQVTKIEDDAWGKNEFWYFIKGQQVA